MEKRLKKLLGDDLEVIAKNEPCHLAVISRSLDDVTAFLLVKLVSFDKPSYNEDGFQPTEKQWKKYFPIIVKYSTSENYISSLFEVLTIDGSNWQNNSFIAAENPQL